MQENTFSFERESLSLRLSRFLRVEIRRGRWGNALPSERQLATELAVSRRVVRQAFLHLKSEGWLVGEGNRKPTLYVRRGATGSKSSSPIRLLEPQTEASSPERLLIVSELRKNFQKSGRSMEVHVDARLNTISSPARILQRLVTENPATCWILGSHSSAVQKWFLEEGVPTVVSATLCEGIDLPGLDIDGYAVGCHVGHLLMRRGHRRIILLRRQTNWVDDMRFEEGFLNACKESDRSGIEPRVVLHPSDTQETLTIIDRLLSGGKNQATAIVAGSPGTFLTLFSRCLQFGISVPKEISLVSRDFSAAFRSLSMQPTCYKVNNLLFAKKLSQLVQHFICGSATPPSHASLIPEFSLGETLADCAV